MTQCLELRVFPEVSGERICRPEVHQVPRRRLSKDALAHGPRVNLADGIHVVTVSEGTPGDLIEAVHLLNLASESERAKQCDLGGGFLPGDRRDTAVAILDGRVVGGVIADRHHQCYLRKILSGKSQPVYVAGHECPAARYIWVHPSHRRKGIGRQLFEALAAHLGCQVAELGHWLPITPSARALLISMGIEEVFAFK